MITIKMISQIHQLLRLLGFTSKCAMFLIDDVFYKQLKGNKFSIFFEDYFTQVIITIFPYRN